MKYFKIQDGKNMRLIDADMLIKDLRWHIEMDKNGHGIVPPLEDMIMSTIMTINKQPIVNEWTPCCKRMPKKDGRYLVTDINGDVVMYVFNSKGNSNEYWKRCAKAWMPFPEPYKGE